MSGAAPDGTRKLPVWRTIIAAYALLFRNWGEALRVGWLPVLAAFALGVVRVFLPSGESWPGFAAVLYGFAVWAAYTPVVAMTVVPWHRYILLERRPRDSIVAVAVTVREGRYAILTVAIMAIVQGLAWAGWLVLYFFGWISGPESVVGVLLSIAGFIFFLAVLAVSFYVSAVLALALPAVAVDRSGGFRDAVELGYRNGWRLTLVVLAAAVPYYVYYYGSNYVPEPAYEGEGGLGILWIFAGAVMFVFEALIAATALSLAYRALGGLRGSAAAPSVIPPGSGG